MKIVVDIPEGLHTNIVKDNCSMADMRILLTVIKNSTPLPKGRWIKHSGWNDDTYNTEYSCSECNEWVDKQSDFCPNCGAEMETETLD